MVANTTAISRGIIGNGASLQSKYASVIFACAITDGTSPLPRNIVGQYTITDTNYTATVINGCATAAAFCPRNRNATKRKVRVIKYVENTKVPIVTAGITIESQSCATLFDNF